MTTAVTVNVPEKAPYAAKVENIDRDAEGGATASLAAILPAGHSSTFHAHSGRAILVSEVTPEETAPVKASDATTA